LTVKGKPKREDLYQALFKHVCQTPCPDGQSWGKQIRGFVEVANVASADQPAMCLAKGFERAVRRREEGVTTWDWVFGLWIYFRVNATVVDADWKFTDDVMDALDANLAAFPADMQSLGGIVNDCFIEGEIAPMPDPEQTQQQTLIVPIVVVTGD
jgi:hypothetical protein